MALGNVRSYFINQVLCSRGVIAKVRIEWFDHGKYTGLFRKADCGLIRLTSAVSGVSVPSWLGSVSSSRLFPCCALKFFRGSGRGLDQDQDCHSGNFLFGGKKTGQQVSRYSSSVNFLCGVN